MQHSKVHQHKQRMAQVGNLLILSHFGPPGSTIFSQQIRKGLRKYLFSLNGPIAPKPSRKSRTAGTKTCFLPTPTQPLPIEAQPSSSSWVNSEHPCGYTRTQEHTGEPKLALSNPLGGKGDIHLLGNTEHFPQLRIHSLTEISEAPAVHVRENKNLHFSTTY